MSSEEWQSRYRRMLSEGTIDQSEYDALVASMAAKLDGGDSRPPDTAVSVETQGGSAVSGSVKVGGHFIGRDYIRIVNRIVHNGEDSEEAESVVAHYLYVLAKDLTRLKLGEIDVAAKDTNREPLQLADVYVPLDTHLRIPQGSTLSEWLSSGRESPRADMDRRQETRPVSALEALAEHRQLTLLGKAGSGKSTFGANVLLTLARTWLGHGESAELGEFQSHGNLLPIRVVLRRFADQFARGGETPRVGDLWKFIDSELEAGGYGLSADTMKYIQRIVREHGALFLLDGLDECGGEETRQRVNKVVQKVIDTVESKSRFLLTARPYAWPAGPAPSQGVYSLADLDDERIEQFIGRWYTALEKRNWLTHEEARRKTGDLLRVRHRVDLKPLTRNPLLLTLTATLHANRGRLPEDRADLYDESVDLLMLRWNRQIGADKALLDELAVPTLRLSDLREVLEELAFKVHAESIEQGEGAVLLQARQRSAEDKGAADIGEDRLVRAFRRLLNNSRDKAAVVVEYIERRAGLLIGQGEKEGERKFTFPHRTFQEFLAACYLAARDDFPAECARLARAAPGHWQEVLPLAARLAKVERGASAADELICGTSVTDFGVKREPGVEEWSCALLAGMQLQEIGAGAIKQRERTRAIADRVAGWLAASLPVHPDKGGLTVSRRAQAGDVLAIFGDPRFDPRRLCLPADAMLGFVYVAADAEFRIGTRKSDTKRIAEAVGYDPGGDEINEKITPSPEFYIARFPVTVAQFGAFIDAAQYEIGDGDALRDPANRPVRRVSWREAADYCGWLNEMLATASACDGSEAARLVREAGWRVALPSELEWEKAARAGLIDSFFPWGDKPDPNRANCDDSEIGDTSAVGCFPANGYDLYDMSGNVWEWTRSLWGSYDANDRERENPAAGNEVLRVVRGGSWRYPDDDARCAYRNWLRPDYRLDDLGFRVVLRSAPVSSAL